MEREYVVKTLVALLKEIQGQVSEDGTVEEVDINTRPIGGMKYFDSLLGEYATVRCFEKFDIKDDGKTLSLLADKKTGEALTVGEIADRIITLKAKGEAK
ncbi:hypothetical protein KIP69_00265 [Geobacter sulfurreducens]|uniref:hypothetical protein n=1 Tax=Geobacter sulfurreducens TaxID=35554 RepID=UPI001BDCDD8C|nr:hypothetical protein [Geobacter sulfurreducens]QVW35320.1 hypothetical protein KIP69_00265 [Geobacter sulfurreducens]